MKVCGQTGVQTHNPTIAIYRSQSTNVLYLCIVIENTLEHGITVVLVQNSMEIIISLLR